MPELPEVETVKRTLEPLVVGEEIFQVRVYYSGIIKCPNAEEFTEYIKGRRIETVTRRGKYLLFSLSADWELIIHLRMTGRLTVNKGEDPLDKHTHLVFELSAGKELRFTDIRKFGMVYLVKSGCWERIHGLFTLGPEPLASEFTLKVLKDKLHGKKTRLKNFLLDQSQIAGIGNIYADEIMFAAGLLPQRKTEDLTDREIARLYSAIHLKLEEGIRHRGTSFRDYVDGKGEKGGFQEKLKVYGRSGQNCSCGSALISIVAAGRTTVYCPKCQG